MAAESRRRSLPFRLRLCPDGRFLQLSPPMAPESLSPGTVIQHIGSTATIYTRRPLEARLFCALHSIPRNGSVPHGPPTARKSPFIARTAPTRESTSSLHLAARRENYAPPEFTGMISRLSVGRPTASGSPSPIDCRRRNMQGYICSQRKHWKPGGFPSIQFVLVKACRRFPTTARTLHTGVFEAMMRPRYIPCRFRTESRR